MTRHWQNSSVLEILTPYVVPVCVNHAFELVMGPMVIQMLYTV